MFFAILSLFSSPSFVPPASAAGFSEIELRAVDQAVGLLPHALALMAPFFFGLCTWRMEAHVQTHPGKALPLTASQLVVVAILSALFGVVSGGEQKVATEQVLSRSRAGGTCSYNTLSMQSDNFMRTSSVVPKLGPQEQVCTTSCLLKKTLLVLWWYSQDRVPM